MAMLEITLRQLILAGVCLASLSTAAQAQYASGAWTVETADGFAAALFVEADSGAPAAEFFCETGSASIEIIIHAFAPGGEDGDALELRLAAGDAFIDLQAHKSALGTDDPANIVASSPTSAALRSVVVSNAPLRIRAAGLEGQLNDDGGRTALSAFYEACAAD